MRSAARRTVGQVAEHLGLDPDTLRYYERRAVVPAPERDAAGRRVYSDRAVHLLEVLVHLRRAGMPLAEIAEFTQLVAADPHGVPERLTLLITQRDRVRAQQHQLQQSMAVIERKIDDYRQRLTRSAAT